MMTEQEIIDAFEDTGGIIKDVAHRLGCTREEVLDAMRDSPAVEAAYEREREKLTDLVESRLVEQINQGNMTAISYYLDRKGGDRGYGKPQSGGQQWGPRRRKNG